MRAKTNSLARWEEDGAKDKREQAASTVDRASPVASGKGRPFCARGVQM